MASRGGSQEQLAKRLFARSRFRHARGWQESMPCWALVVVAWRLVDPVTRVRFRARARETLSIRTDPKIRFYDDAELDIRYDGAS